MGTETRRREKRAEEQRQHQKRQGKRAEREGVKRVREGEGRVKEARETAAQPYRRKVEEAELGTGWGV